MMSDIASLGLEVRSDQVKKGAADLERLTAAAARAEAATMGVATGARQAAAGSASVSSSSAQAAVALDREAAAAKRAAQSLTAHTKVANDNMRRLGGSMSGLAAQFQDIGVTAAAGMSPAIIGLQQGAQIAGQMEAAMQGGASAVSVLGTAFKSLLSPVTLVSIALTALAALGIQMVNWPQLAASALNGLADVLVTIAPYATAAAAAIALLYAPAIIGGIGTLISTLWSLVAALGATTAAFIAANPAVAFVLGLTAAVAAANIFRDELAQIFGRDIVGDAKNAVNAVIGFFVGAYDGIVAAWGALPAALGDLGYQAADRFYAAVTEMLRNLRAEINSFIEGINGKFGTAIPVLGGGLIGLNDDGTQKHIANPYSGAASGVAKTFQGSIDAAQGVDYVGGVYQAIGRGASAAASKLKELAAGLGVTTEKKKSAKSEAEKLAEKYDRILLSAEAFIAEQMAERDALFLTEEAAKALRYEQDMLNRAIQAGISIDAAKAAEIRAYAQAMASAEIETSRMREALDFAKDVTKGFFSDLRSGLEQGKGFWRSFGDAALNVLDKIVDKLLNDVIDAIFQVNSAGGGGGGLLGMLGGLFGLGGGGGGFSSGVLANMGTGTGFWAKGGAFENGISGFSNTVVNRPTPFFFAKGAGIMGEAGPEAIMPLRRDGHGRLGVIVAGNSNQPAAANQNGTSTVRLIMPEGWKAEILEQAADQTIQIVQENNRAQENRYQNGAPR
jgi:hypothetical protein